MQSCLFFLQISEIKSYLTAWERRTHTSVAEAWLVFYVNPCGLLNRQFFNLNLVAVLFISFINASM